MSKPIITLTIEQIAELAEFAGLTVVWGVEIDPETELTITECPPEGLLEDEGDATGPRYQYLAHVSEHPDEGSIGLGPEQPT